MFYRIETEVNNLTFISADIFLPKPLDTLLEEDSEAIFFPSIVNYEALYNWKRIPFHLNVMDSETVIESKRRFCSKYETSNQILGELLKFLENCYLIFYTSKFKN